MARARQRVTAVPSVGLRSWTAAARARAERPARSAARILLAPPASIDATIAGARPVSDALAELQALLRRAAVGYQRLWVAGSNLGSRSTFRLAAEHMRAYAAAASELIPLVSEVMIWELREAGQECRCACAPRAGLRSGDRIATADGAEIRDPWSLVNAANAAEKYGAPLTLGIERANGASENVTLTPRQSDPDAAPDQRQS